MPDGNQCPQCGTSLPSGALAGLCPACLLKMGAAADTVTEGKQPAFTPPSVAELAPLFPQLEILELIGKGGMGAVYKARQKQLDRIVALKILPPGIGHDAAFAERFAREAKALAKLNHPGIVTLYEFGAAESHSPSPLAPRLFFFLMEFVDGLNLRQLLHAGRVSAREALAIVPQICDALQFAHDQGIVHRDIKPENILLDRRGRVKVADFGLAKIVGAEGGASVLASRLVSSLAPPAESPLTDVDKIMGTPQYMSPEQRDNPGEVDHRADIYALGVVFYQMLTGELPGKKIEAPSKKVQIDVRLDEVVLRALEQKPELRYQQASVLKTQVETIAETPEPGRRRGAASQTETTAASSQKPESGLRSKMFNPFEPGETLFGKIIDWGWKLLFIALFLLWIYDKKFSEATNILGGWFSILFVAVLTRFFIHVRKERIAATSQSGASGCEPAPPESQRASDDLRRLTSAAATGGARFSRTAIAGVGLVILAVVMFSLAGIVSSVATVVVMPDGQSLPNKPAKLVSMMLVLAGLLCALISTLLGWIAVSQIRRASGKIYGMWLAVFDGLIFPLLALSALVIWAGNVISGLIPPKLSLLLVPVLLGLIALAVYRLTDSIIRRVWSAVNNPQASSNPSSKERESALSVPPSPATIPMAPIVWRKLRIVAALFIFSGVWSLLDMLFDNGEGNATIMPGALLLPLGIGLLNRREFCRRAAPWCVGAGFVFNLIMLGWLFGKAFGLFAGLDVVAKVLGQPMNSAVGAVLTFLFFASQFILLPWMFLILMRDEVRSAFARAQNKPRPFVELGLTVLVLLIMFGYARIPFENRLKTGVYFTNHKPAPTTQTNEPIFGPVMERVVAVFDENPAQACLDVGSGEFHAPAPVVGQRLRDLANQEDGETYPGRNPINMERDAWLNSSGVDLIGGLDAEGHPTFKYIGQPPHFQNGWPTFASADAKDVLQMLQASPFYSGDKPNLPAGYVNVINPRLLSVQNAGFILFRTHDGDVGVMQVLGTNQNPRGVKIRYKLVQNAVTTVAPVSLPVAANSSAFSPVVEFILRDPIESRTNCFVDFEAGRLVVPPVDLVLTNRAAVLDWVKAEGVDAIANTSRTEVRGLLGYGLTAVRLADEEWDRPTEGNLGGEISKQMWNNSRFGGLPADAQMILTVNIVSTDPKPSKTYGFRTSQGTLGLLQFLEYTDAPRGWVKIRYKLVQSSDHRASGVIHNEAAAASSIFSFRLVARADESEVPVELLAGPDRLTGGQKLPVFKHAELTAHAIQRARLRPDGRGSWQVDFQLTPEGKIRFAELTRTNVGRQLALVYRGRILTAPRVNSEILSGKGAINGNFTESEAAELTWQLNHLHGRSAAVNEEREFLLQLDPERSLAGQPALLDLDQAQLREWPAEFVDWNEHRRGQWVDVSDADLLIAGPGFAPRLGVFAMSLAPADASSWTTPPSRAGVLEMISQAGTNWCGAPTNPVPDLGEDVRAMNLDCPLPATYAFRTAAGAAGLLQITALTDNPLGVNIRYKLVQSDASNSVGSLVKDSSNTWLTEPPKLRFLAWQDEWKTNQPFAARYPDGSPLTNATELQWLKEVPPGSLDVTSLKLDHEPHFLHLWFSHPAFTRNNFTELSLLNDAGNPIKLGGQSSVTGGFREATERNGNLGWAYWTLSPGETTNHPARVTVRLRYTMGPLERTQELAVTPNTSTSMSLEGGSQLNGMGQDVDGRAFVAIAVAAKKMSSRQFDAVAITKDGRELPPAGSERGGTIGGDVRIERFEFEVPLTDVTKFIIGTRPIRTNEWKDVVLPPK